MNWELSSTYSADDRDESESQETDCLRKYVRKHVGYGTHTQPLDGNEVYLIHLINQTDTLQGIALKYSVTMEQLRRLNRLWTNDSIQMRYFIIIPTPAVLKSTRKEEAPVISKYELSDSTILDEDYVKSLVRKGIGTKQHPLSRVEAMKIIGRTFGTNRRIGAGRNGLHRDSMVRCVSNSDIEAKNHPDKSIDDAKSFLAKMDLSIEKNKSMSRLPHRKSVLYKLEDDC